MSESRQANERRDFVFSVRRAGVAGFVLPAMRAKYRGISIVQLLAEDVVVIATAVKITADFSDILIQSVCGLGCVLFSSGKSAVYGFVQRKNGIKTGNAKRSNRRAV